MCTASIHYFFVTVRKHISVGTRVSAPRGNLFSKEHGRERQKRGIWLGFVVEYVSDGCSKILWDDGKSFIEKSSQFKMLAQNANKIPFLPLSLDGNAPIQARRNGVDLLPDYNAGRQAVEVFFRPR